jgi:hypothetical protein
MASFVDGSAVSVLVGARIASSTSLLIHGLHVDDITDHVWTDHDLNLQDVCGKCGDARWARGFLFLHHTSGCAGGKPARCVGCCQIFRLTIALVVHVELGQCTRLVFE